MARTWFTSDLHLSHVNIIDYSRRPYADVQAMDDDLVARHNAVVAPADTVWVLGDVALGKTATSLERIAELNGTLHLVAGNHDRCWKAVADLRRPLKRGEDAPGSVRMYLDAGFASVQGRASLTVGGRQVLLHHLPYVDPARQDDKYRDRRPADKGRWLLCGHVHERWRQRGRQLNVGVDAWGGAPVAGDTLAELMRAGPADLPPLPWETG